MLLQQVDVHLSYPHKSLCCNCAAVQCSAVQCCAVLCSAVQHKSDVQLQRLLLRHNTVTDIQQTDIWQTCILTVPIKSLTSALAFATTVPLGQAFSASADCSQHSACSNQHILFPRLSLPSAERTQQLWSSILTGKTLGQWHNKAKNQSHLDTSGFVCLTSQKPKWTFSFCASAFGTDMGSSWSGVGSVLQVLQQMQVQERVSLRCLSKLTKPGITVNGATPTGPLSLAGRGGGTPTGPLSLAGREGGRASPFPGPGRTY